MSNGYIVGSKEASGPMREKKKMGWFTRWFDRRVKEAWERHNDYSGNTIVAVRETNQIDADGMNIRLFSATGGTIVEFRRYDRTKDRHDNKMYVIPVEHNFNEQFTKIVSMEMLR